MLVVVRLTCDMERCSVLFLPCTLCGSETLVPWVPVLTSESEFSVLMDTSLWLLHPPWLEKENKTKNKANKRLGTVLGQKGTSVLRPSGTNWFMQRSNY